MSDKQLYRLGVKGCAYRRTVAQQVIDAEDGAIARITPATRNLDQNARFHAMCGDVAKQIKHFGRVLDPAQWKVMFISGLGVVTGEGSDVVPGLEGEMCNIRESSASMGVKRMADLITYVQAFGDTNEVKWSEVARQA
jgi:hypothetical protein